MAPALVPFKLPFVVGRCDLNNGTQMRTCQWKSTLMSSIGERLKEEREQLGFNQTAFGAVGGVQKQAQLKYEKGERYPGADYLAAVAKVGADVQYIVTGVRCPAALSDDESELIARFRKAPVAVKASALAGLAAGSEPPPKGPKQVFHGNVGQVAEGPITNEAGVSFNFGVKKTKE